MFAIRKFNLIAIVLLAMAVLPNRAQPFHWGVISFRNYILHDQATGETYNAPLFFYPGLGWGADPGAYAELYLVQGELKYLLGQTTFRTNSAEAMAYLHAVDLEVPGHQPGESGFTFVVRLYPAFGSYLETAPFTVMAPLGGTPWNGGFPIIQPGLDGFQSIGCPQAYHVDPYMSLHTVGDNVTLQIVPSEQMIWRRYTPIEAYRSWCCGTSLTLTNVQETDTGRYAAETYCPGIPTLAPWVSVPSTLVVIPPIQVATTRQDGMQHFFFPSREGVIYSLQKSDTLTPPAWQDLPITGGVIGTTELVDTNAMAPMMFYRVVARLPPPE